MIQLTSSQLRLLRSSRNLLQKQVAAKMGIGKQRYSQLENHKKGLPVETQEKIVKAFGYTLESALVYLNSIPHET